MIHLGLWGVDKPFNYGLAIIGILLNALIAGIAFICIIMCIIDKYIIRVYRPESVLPVSIRISEPPRQTQTTVINQHEPEPYTTIIVIHPDSEGPSCLGKKNETPMSNLITNCENG